MFNHQRTYLSKLLNFLVFAAIASVSSGPQAFGDESIEQLLDQVDQTLNTGKTSKPDHSDGPKRRRQAPQQKPSDEKVEATPKPPMPLSTPNLFNMPEETASLQHVDAPRYGRVTAGVGSRKLNAVGRLEKDDDTFAIDGAQRLTGVTLAIDHQLSEIPAGDRSVGIFAGGGVSVYRGELDIRRTGVFNEDMKADMTLVPWNATIGARFPSSGRFFVETTFQAIIEAINQSGRGVTDTVSDVLPSDAFTIGLGMKFGDRFAGLASWQQRGVLLNSENSSIPGSSATVAVGAYL